MWCLINLHPRDPGGRENVHTHTHTAIVRVLRHRPLPSPTPPRVSRCVRAPCCTGIIRDNNMYVQCVRIKYNMF